MATELKFLDLTGLQTYDAKIKTYIDTEDGKSIKNVVLDGQHLKFYKVDPVTQTSVVAFDVELPQQDVQSLMSKVSGATNGDIAILNSDGEVTDSGTKLTTITGNIGNLTSLTTTNKTSLVTAINEVKSTADGASVSIDTSKTTNGYLKTYTIKQGESEVGKIDIPKDLVVTSGTVETNPEGQVAGTYIKLQIANQDEPLYINVGTLVDIYNQTNNAIEVQVTVDNTTHTISASLVDGGVGTAKLADNAVTTAKILDQNVTKEKLEQDVQDSLGKADNAFTYAASGTTNGTIKIGKTESTANEISVAGLGSAAYKTAGSAVNNVPEIGAALGTTANVPVVTDSTGKLIPHASGALGNGAFYNFTAITTQEINELFATEA